MVGMIQIMTYLLCLYLVFKAIEIFQIAYVSTSEQARKRGMILGGIMIVVSIAAGLYFSWLAETQAAAISEGLRNMGR